MDFDELCLKAYKNELISEYTSLPERYAYIRLKELYEKYRYGDLSKEKALTLKNKIKKDYLNDSYEYNRILEVYQEYNKNRIENSSLLFQLEKEKDINKKMEICIKIISHCVSDNTMVERFKNKLC